MAVAADIYYHIYQAGERLPVVLLHGAGGTNLNWPSQVRRLTGFKVYALDLPGHGRSGGRGQQTIQGYAVEIITWMRAVGLHNAFFIGHSMGGAIAQVLALDYPEHVLGIGVVASGARLRVMPQLLQYASSSDTFAQAVALVIAGSFGPQAAPRLVELAARVLAGTRPSVLHGDFLACNSFDVMGRVAELRLPCLLVFGEDDQMTPPRYARFLYDHIPGARLEIVPQAGHMVMLEKPQAVADILADFLGTIEF